LAQQKPYKRDTSLFDWPNARTKKQRNRIELIQRQQLMLVACGSEDVYVFASMLHQKLPKICVAVYKPTVVKERKKTDNCLTFVLGHIDCGFHQVFGISKKTYITFKSADEYGIFFPKVHRHESASNKVLFLILW
jgi:hypothetical protein